jgi:C1A family cysteine protease
MANNTAGSFRKYIRFSVFYFVFIFLLALSTFAAEPSLAPVNPDFANYVQNPHNFKADKQIKKRHSLGLIPPTVDLSHMKGQRITRKLKDVNGMTVPLVGGGSFPPAYDLRSLGKVTPVKDQDPFDTCWSFATYSSLESCLLTAETWSFSERNLVNLAGFYMGEADGGNYLMSTAYLARWGGAG